MTTTLPDPTRVPGPRVHYSQRGAFRPTDDYDDYARWADDTDQSQRWRWYAACRDQQPELFFPEGGQGSDEGQGVEPAYPPPEVKSICDRCPVRAQCLNDNLNEEFGIYGGTTGYQRGLMTRKIRRKACVGCGSTDVVDKVPHHEVCLACGVSWEVL